MTDNTKIEWADATVNAINGCSVISPGCTNCYAMRSGGRNLPNYPSTGLTAPSKAGPVWTGEVRLNEKALLQPLKWKRPRRIFWNAHGDMFHDNVPDDWIDRCFAVMALTPQHIHMVLTKRPERMRAYIGTACGRIGDQVMALRRDFGFPPSAVAPLPHIRVGAEWWPLPNVWLGVSAEDQARADERIPDLLETSAAVRFVSCEPLLGYVDLGCIEQSGTQKVNSFCVDMFDAIKGEGWIFDEDGELDRIVAIPRIDWVIAGGESGSGARPMHPDWVRDLRDQCKAAGVPFHFKQWGQYLPAGQLNGEGVFWNPSCGSAMRATKKLAGRFLDGVTHDGMPA